MRTLQIISGSFLLLLGLAGVFFGFAEMFDPAGSKMADDADPFGPPRTLIESSKLTGFFGLVSLAGIWFVSRAARSATAIKKPPLN